MTRPNHAYMYSDQEESSVFVNWMKQVCPQTRLRWWKWWGTPDIIWNRDQDRKRSKRKWAIIKCCLTVCRSIEKRNGVCAGASYAEMWYFFGSMSVTYDASVLLWNWYHTQAILQVLLALTWSQLSDFKCVVVLDNFGRRKITRAA